MYYFALSECAERTPVFPARLLFSENIVATLYPGPAAAAAPQRAASFWPQKPQLFVGSIHCGTWFCGFSEEWGMTERSGRDPGAGIRSARTGEILTAGNLALALGRDTGSNLMKRCSK